MESLSEQQKQLVLEAGRKLRALSFSYLSRFLGEPGSCSCYSYTTMELNAWEVQQLNHLLLEGQGMAGEVLMEKPDAIVRDVETRREALVLRLYDLLLRLDETHVSRGGRVCADRLWEIIFSLLATLCF